MILLRLAAFCLLACVGLGCGASDAYSYELSYELRAPATPGNLRLDPRTRFSLVARPDSVGSAPLTHMARRDEPGYVVLGREDLIFRGQRDRAVVVEFLDGRPAQVFRLPVPRAPRVTDWSPWRPPDFVEPADGESTATWTYLDGRASPRRSTDVPPDAFQLRYRISNWPGAAD